MKLAQLDAVIAMIGKGLSKGAEARDAAGTPVNMDDPMAEVFDIRAAFALAMCDVPGDLYSGMQRSYECARSIHQGLGGAYHATNVRAYAALADWNDDPTNTKAVVLFELGEWRKRLVAGDEARKKAANLRRQHA